MISHRLFYDHPAKSIDDTQAFPCCETRSGQIAGEIATDRKWDYHDSTQLSSQRFGIDALRNFSLFTSTPRKTLATSVVNLEDKLISRTAVLCWEPSNIFTNARRISTERFDGRSVATSKIKFSETRKYFNPHRSFAIYREFRGRRANDPRQYRTITDRVPAVCRWIKVTTGTITLEASATGSALIRRTGEGFNTDCRSMTSINLKLVSLGRQLKASQIKS